MLRGNTGVGYDVLVNSFDNNGVNGRQLQDGRYVAPCSIPWKHCKGAQFEVIHFFRSARTEYSGVRDFLFGDVTHLTRRFWLGERVKQWLFNKTSKFRQDRISLLRTLLETHIKRVEESENAFSAPSSMSEILIFETTFGSRAFGHPEFNRRWAAFKIIVDSLVESGDLRRVDNRITVAPKAIETLANHELQERRHNDSVRQNWLMLTLTVVISGAAAVQILDSVGLLSLIVGTIEN